MQTLKFIGRGSAFNTNEGNTSAYIKRNGHLYLIDCGEDVFMTIQALHLLDDVEKVTVLITHLNSDHVGSLSSLIFYCFYMKKIVPTIYFPNPEIIQLLRINGHSDNQYHYVDEINNMIDDIAFRFASTRHIDAMHCYGILISIDDKLIYYSGDSKIIPINIKTNLFIIDEFYQDTSLADYDGNVHLSLKKLCELIPKEYRSKVYCMHLDCHDLIKEAQTKGFNVVYLS